MSSPVAPRYAALLEWANEELRRRDEKNKIRVQVGSATCEHAAGSRDVREEFVKHIRASGRDDIVLHQTGCTGRCSCEPIVGVFIPGEMPIKYERVDRPLAHEIFTTHVLGGEPLRDRTLDDSERKIPRFEILVCTGERCFPDGGTDFCKVFGDKLKAAGVDMSRVTVTPASCFGACSNGDTGTGTHVLVRPAKVLYRIKTVEDVEEIIRSYREDRKMVDRLLVKEAPVSQEFLDLYGDVAFFNRQVRIALRNCGVVNPESLKEYLHYKGFAALARVLEKGDPQWAVDEISESHLRGRGGGGYPTGLKWSLARQSSETERYIICNADEGDPGAFMDRSMLESDPFSVIEGMTIGAYAIGAHQGFFYVRAEYPLSIKRIENALALCREHGLLGKDILGSGFDLDLEIRLGAGAFVCGEETALIHSIEGERGQPRIRPPYPTEQGLWEKPTVINNVETFANVPVIINYGGPWFARVGSDVSGGSKVFALAGKVVNTGLVEVPMGTTLREVVFEIGGGVPDGRQLKAIQTGGPAGGCIPAKWLDTMVDFDSLTQAGSIMGSGGMIVMDDADCMVDIARFFMTFSQDESCGKCTPCREGTKRMLEILDRIVNGKGEASDLDQLERLGNLMKKASLCGLGRAAANPVLSTLRHFRDEYEAHVEQRQCPAKKCVALVHFEIIPEKCVGCMLCAKKCPVQCITGKRKEVHVIDQAICIKCGMCFEVCRFEAVARS